MFSHGYRKPGAESCTPTSSDPMQGTLASSATNARDTSIGKRKRNDDEKEGQWQQKKPKAAPAQDENQHECEEEEFRQVEDFIVNAIHDDDFLKLVERIGCVWQRMGFDDVGANFFGARVPDR